MHAYIMSLHLPSRAVGALMDLPHLRLRKELQTRPDALTSGCGAAAGETLEAVFDRVQVLCGTLGL